MCSVPRLTAVGSLSSTWFLLCNQHQVNMRLISFEGETSFCLQEPLATGAINSASIPDNVKAQCERLNQILLAALHLENKIEGSLLFSVPLDPMIASELGCLEPSHLFGQLCPVLPPAYKYFM